MKVVISAISKEKEKSSEHTYQNWVSLPPPQLSSLSTRVVNVLENDKTKRKHGRLNDTSTVKKLSITAYWDMCIPSAVVSIVPIAIWELKVVLG